MRTSRTESRNQNVITLNRVYTIGHIVGQRILEASIWNMRRLLQTGKLAIIQRDFHANFIFATQNHWEGSRLAIFLGDEWVAGNRVALITHKTILERLRNT